MAEAVAMPERSAASLSLRDLEERRRQLAAEIEQMRRGPAAAGPAAASTGPSGPSEFSFAGAMAPPVSSHAGGLLAQSMQEPPRSPRPDRGALSMHAAPLSPRPLSPQPASLMSPRPTSGALQRSPGKAALPRSPCPSSAPAMGLESRGWHSTASSPSKLGKETSSLSAQQSRLEAILAKGRALTSDDSVLSTAGGGAVSSSSGVHAAEPGAAVSHSAAGPSLRSGRTQVAHLNHAELIARARAVERETSDAIERAKASRAEAALDHMARERKVLGFSGAGGSSSSSARPIHHADASGRADPLDCSAFGSSLYGSRFAGGSNFSSRSSMKHSSSSGVAGLGGGYGGGTTSVEAFGDGSHRDVSTSFTNGETPRTFTRTPAYQSGPLAMPQRAPSLDVRHAGRDTWNGLGTNNVHDHSLSGHMDSHSSWLGSDAGGYGRHAAAPPPRMPSCFDS
eukprot:TRINITY_DN17545_c0_g1_i1.p1 TRINITY_DN17545_c0_g1~~TRINITY_DN17545_c0_g1_i1.p1  ORF type:complete len:453 (-),score=84.29 TRINITY_DN17545_c0_g1_i1:101-1459(-)